MSGLDPPSFQENDIELLETGNFADGTIKCQGRTWKVHRALLASRLRFFRSAFCGSFAEARSGVVDFPEADPDAVDIMIRHLYRQGIDVKELDTPRLCVRCWRLADYVRLRSLKSVAISSLGQHFDAMALLAKSNHWRDHPDFIPKWLNYFFDTLREVCLDDSTKPLHLTFATFLWVTQRELVALPQTFTCLTECQGVHEKLLKLLVLDDPGDEGKWPDWIRGHSSRWKSDFDLGHWECDECVCDIGRNQPVFSNPLPFKDAQTKDNVNIEELRWCAPCVAKFNEECRWPWRASGGPRGEKLRLKAWSWSDEDWAPSSW